MVKLPTLFIAFAACAISSYGTAGTDYAAMIFRGEKKEDGEEGDNGQHN